MKWMETLKKHADNGALMSVKEVAQVFSVTPQHIYTMMKAGRIPGASRISNHSIRFCPETLLEWSKKKVVSGGATNNSDKSD